MSTNINEFVLEIRLYSEQTLPELAHQRVAAVGMELTRGVVELTPVDKGRLKGNWQATLGMPAEGERDRFDASPAGSSAGSPALAEAEAALSRWRGEWFWLHNGVPYASAQEDGTEGRPGRHMVSRTVERLSRSFG